MSSSFKSSKVSKVSKYDRNIFELQPLEVRKLLTTAAIEAGALLHIIGTANAETITVNQLSNGKVSVSGVTTQFTPGTQFTRILIEAGGGNDTVQITNNVTYSTATLTGNAGNDTITSGKGADQVFGAAGNDDLHGGVGNDYMDGNAGNDNMIGDDGFDTANYSDRATAVRVTLDGAANDGEVSQAEADNVQCEEVLGGAGNDTLTGSNTASDYLSGGGGADALTGNGGNDELTAGSGGDNLQGGQGDDYLHAQNNDKDTVNGGTGPGATDHDLAEIDGLDVSGIAAGGSSLNANIPNQGAISNNPADLDGTYGTGGKVSDQNLGFTPNAEAIDSQGRVVYVGTIFNHQNAGFGYGAEMIAARYDANGNRDSTFGSGGTELIDFTPNGGVGSGYNDDDEAFGVVIGAGDSIFVIGETTTEFSSNTDTAVAKLTSSGQLDATFGTGGVARTDTSGDSFTDYGIMGAVTNTNGVVVLGTAGSEGGSPRLSRFSATGVVDNSFDPAVDIESPNAVALQTLPGNDATQRVVIAGANSDGTWELERFLSTGVADSSFGTDGVVTHDFGGTPFTSSVGGMIVDASNDIVVAGAIGNIPSMLTSGVPTPADGTTAGVLAKFAAADGTFVAAASHNGVSEGNSASFSSVAQDAQGRYVISGQEENDSGWDFLVARVNSNMTPDNTFGLGGVTTTDFGPGYDDFSQPVSVLGDGKIIVAGTSFFFIPDSEGTELIPAIARYRGGDTTPPNGEQQVTEVEDFSNYGELHQQPPTPRMQAIFNRISDIAKNNLLWQPDDQGIVRVELDDKNNTVKFSTIVTGDGKLNVVMNVDGILTEYYDPTTTKQIQLSTKGGNDVILANNSITIPMLIDAGAGNDIVAAGAGNDIIYAGTGIDLVNANAGNDVVLGGAGIDGLYGDGGRDIVIGGADPDAIAGGADDDIEIAGTTSYDTNTAANVAALKTIIAEWGSAATYANRIIHIRSGVGGLNGTNVLRGPGVGQTVFNDGVIDVLTNDAGQDWFFARTTGNAAVKDQILGGLGGETKDEI